MEQPKTVAQMQWLFRDTALWATQQHNPSGGIDAVRQVLRRLNIEHMPIGPGVSLRNPYDMADLPQGTILSQNQVTSDAYRVYVHVGNGGLKRMLGTDRSGRGPFLVCEMPGGVRPAWLDVEPDSDEPVKIATWKKEAWKVGYQAKVDRGWCGDFERVMFSMEIRP